MTLLKKRLYAVTSYHQLDSEETNERYRGVAEVRERIIGAIASSLAGGFYFSDSLTDEQAALLNQALVEHSLKEIQRLKRSTPVTHDCYEHGLKLEAMKRARLGGSHFVFKATEVENPIADVMMSDEFYEHEKFAGLSEDAMLESVNGDLRGFMDARVIMFRDRRIIKLIEENGADENILYMGNAHILQALQKSKLEWYRLRVDRVFDQIVVEGFVPNILVKTITRAAGKRIFERDVATCIRGL